jgi:hypothetical protein
MNIKTAVALGVLVFLVSGCQQPGDGGSPFETYPPIPYKRLITNSDSVEMICYVDTEKYNPLNAKDYIFSAGAETPETQFFNHVVLAYAYMIKDGRGYTRIGLSPALKYILDNGKTYIKPLQLKGIRVLVELRSGICSETEDGQGAGLGTMDMAAINEFTKELKNLVDHYGIDGFDFNDIGGGRRSYPPLTRQLTRFQSNNPMYPDNMFEDTAGNPLGDTEVEAILWREGGNNLSNLVQRANEILKEKKSFVLENGNPDSILINQEIQRVFLVRAQNHGDKLIYKIRDAYMPDAYAGANAIVAENLGYIINGFPYDNTKPHASLWDENMKRDAGPEADHKYAPFAVDLSDQKDTNTARLWANTFLLKDPDGGRDLTNQNRYGALFFTDLRPVSEGGDIAAYLTYFSQILFGRVTRLAEGPGGGNYPKTW